VAAMCDKLQEEGGPVVEAAMEGTRFKL